MSISDRQNDTSTESIKEKSFNAMQRIQKLAGRPPFTQLYRDLLACNLTEFNLGPQILNDLITSRNMRRNAKSSQAFPINFASDKVLQANSNNALNENYYYEDYIFKFKSVPTRSNWHDFFNGLIWLQFSQTKSYFNAMHHQQIQTYGRKKRTPIRDRLTHFDECGLLLVTNQKELKYEIQTHNWQKVFVERKAQWHKEIQPIIFGHALWEMLMNPYIGLTAKVTIIDSESLLHAPKDNMLRANSELDQLLLSNLHTAKTIEQRKPWLPLPLLGIPNWCHLPQNEAFYANQNYFMPKSK